ncbi:unnamed protein product [Rhizophagus irregularis]|nr:unnamed protein product [Rhizophagus irregularis]
MPKTLRDMYSELIRAIDFNDQRAKKIQAFGIIHLGFMDPIRKVMACWWNNLHFSISICQHKTIIKDNLQILNIQNINPK